MKLNLATILIMVWYGVGAQPQQHVENNPTETFQLSSGLRFEENKGQVANTAGEVQSDILFTMKDKGITLFFRKDGISYQWSKREKMLKGPYKISESTGLPADGKESNTDESVILQTYRMDMQWVGSSKNVEVVAEGSYEDFNNYYLAQCPDGVLGVKSYRKLVYKNIYPNTDVVYYVKDSTLKYDIILHQGAIPNNIAITYSGSQKQELKNGKFKLYTPLGTLEEQEPVAYTSDKQIVDVNYKMLKNGSIQFDLQERIDSEIVIDPVLIWGTYYGGNVYDAASTTVVDGSGNVFIGGETTSNAGIAAGGHDITEGGGDDSFVVKFNSNGVRQWGTYYGGTGNEEVTSLAVDGTQNIYAVGSTNSNTPIATVGAYQVGNGGGYDAFVVKFSSNGVRSWGTFYGGGADDFPNAIAIDGSGDIFIGGNTQSMNNMASAGSHKNAITGAYDAFLAKLGPNGNTRVWGTYYGGANNDFCFSIDIDASGNVYIAGQTVSNAEIATVGAHDETIDGTSDSYLVKFNTGGVRQWGTYYGGSQNESGSSVAIDNAGDIYLAGYTNSNSSIELNGHQNAFGGIFDGFLVKFNSSGTRQWGTYYGGTADDRAWGVDVDASGNVYICGETSSATGIASGGYKNNFGGGANDAYLVKFNSAGTRQWATYYGGTDQEQGNAVITSGDAVYLAGLTQSTNGGLAYGGHQNSLSNAIQPDGFLAKFLSTDFVPPVIAAPTNVMQYSFSANWAASAGATSYYLDVSTSSTFDSYVPTYLNYSVGNVTTFSVNTNLNPGTTYYYRVTAYAYGGMETAHSGVQSVQTLPGPPPTPVSSTPTLITQTSFSANWAASVGATGYYLDVSASSIFSSFVTGYNNLSVGNVTSYSVNSNLTAGVTYYYRVRAFNANGTSGNSGNQSVTLLVPPVTSAATSVAQTSFAANWSASTGATAYFLDVSTESDFSSFVTGYNNLSVGNVTTYSVNTNIIAGTTYYYRVRATNGTGNSGNSSNQTVLTIPSNPVSSGATAIAQTSFSANWAASPSATGYQLDVSGVSDFSSFVTGYNNVAVGNVTTYSVNANLTAGMNYYYRVRAVNSGGVSGNSENQSLLTLATPVSSAATSITQTSFSTNWSSAIGATGYFLDVSTVSNFAIFLPGYNNLSVGASTTYGVNAGLNAGTTYYYRVRSGNGMNASVSSGSQTVLTLPPNPISLSASSLGSTSFSANWQSSTSATDYSIDVTTDAGFINHVTGSPFTVGNVTTTSITSLNANTNYYYRVRALNASGPSGNSGPQAVLTLPAPPSSSAPTSITQTSFSANWSASAGATGYYLDVSTVNNFSSFVTGYNNLSVGNVTTLSVNTNLTVGTNYYYRVRVQTASGVSGNSVTQTLLTLPPNPVSLASSSITSISFSANWQASTSATGYSIDVTTDPGFTAHVTGSPFTVGNVTTTSITSLNANTNYYYRVRALNASGASGNSGSQSVLTLPPPPSSTAPTSITQTSFLANWSVGAGATGYYLDVSTVNNFSSFVTGYNNLSVGNVTSYAVNTNLAAGTAYYYRVRSQTAGGVSDHSVTQTALTLPPNPVSLAGSSLASTSFSANWQSSASATSYVIDVTTDAGFATHVTGSPFIVGNVTTTSITGLAANTTYYYRVRATNASGTSGNSGSQSVLTLPTPPTISAATLIGQSSFTANWSGSAGAIGYNLDVSTVNDFSSFVTGYNNLSVGNVTTYAVNTSIIAGTNYYYRVRGVYAGGTSDYSGHQAILTLPPDPVSLAATSVGATSFSANWQAAASATGYILDVTTDAGFTSHVSGSPFTVGNVTTTNITGLVSGVTHYYRVRASNASGLSGNSGSQMVAPIPVTPQTLPPSAITQTSFNANWSASQGATGYILDVMIFNVGFAPDYSSLAVGNVTTYPVNINITPGTSYYYAVRATNASGASGQATTAVFLTLPANPTSAAASSITQSSFSANWSPVISATGYVIDVSANQDFSSQVTGSPFSVGNVTTSNIAALSSGTNYYYRVRASNASGESGNSQTQSLLLLPADPVSAASTSVTQTSFSANWSAVPSATGYSIDVATSQNFSSPISGSPFSVGNVLTTSITGLVPGTTYYNRVRSVNASGISGNSNIISTLTLPVITDVSTDPLPNNKLELSPNPVTDVLTIELPGGGLKQIGIYNSVGTLIEAFETHDNTYRLLVKSYLPAIYFVHVTTGNRIFQGKFLKK